MSFAVLNKRNGYTDLGTAQQPNSSAPLLADLVGRLVASANGVIARGLVSQNRLRYLPAQAATAPIQAFVKLVTPAGPFLAEVISEANAMSGRLTRTVSNGRGGSRTIPMGVVQAADARMDPLVKSIVVPLRLLVQLTTLRMQDPSALMAAVGKVLVRQGLWNLDKLKGFLQRLPGSNAVNALKDNLQRLGAQALNPGAAMAALVNDAKNVLSHIPGLSLGALGEGDDGMSFESSGEMYGSDTAGPAADTTIPPEPTAEMPVEPGSGGDAPVTDSATPPPVKAAAGDGTKGVAGSIPQIIALINQLLRAGHDVSRQAEQAKAFVDQVTGRQRQQGPAAAPKVESKSIIAGVPDIALLAVVAGGAFLVLKR